MIYYGFWTNYVLLIGIFLVLIAETAVLFRAWAGRGRLKTIFGNLLVFLCMAWGCFIALETYYRFIYDKTEAYGLCLTSARWMQRHMKYNTKYFRDREHVPKKEGTYRIGIVGDSITAGWGIEDPERRVSNLLEKRLRAAYGTHIEVYNCGQGGWDTGHQLTFLLTYRDFYDFDEIILAYFINDIADLVPIEDWPFQLSMPDSSFLKRFYFPNHLIGRMLLLRNRHTRYSDFIIDFHSREGRWQEQAGRIEDFVNLCGKFGAKVNVVIYPFLDRMQDDDGAAWIHARLDKLLERLQVPHLDLRDAFRDYSVEELRVNALDLHPNEEANALACEAIYQKLYSHRTDLERPPGND
jgi:hypothetical protein